jgi:2-dehydro-3-deoxygluconokinase
MSAVDVPAGSASGGAASADPAPPRASAPVGPLPSGPGPGLPPAGQPEADRFRADSGTAGPEVVCLGEAMVMLTPASARPLAERPHLATAVGGAESNVACTLARLGHRTAWVGRVGDDPFGAMVTGDLAGHGVDVSGVGVDPGRPTGVYVKDPAPGGTRVYYYRRGSAASAMGPDTAAAVLSARPRLVHLSGVTPALSESCAALVDRLVPGASAGPITSFDVNHRPRLWAGGAAETLRRLADAADVVFVGRDEAEALWGTSTADEVRALLPRPRHLVVKDAGEPAVEFHPEGRTAVPAPRARIVEPVGAGDAFAAGFLSGLLTGRPAEQRLRLGHLCAAATLGTVTDLAPLPAPETIDGLLTTPSWPHAATEALSRA